MVSMVKLRKNTRASVIFGRTWEVCKLPIGAHWRVYGPPSGRWGEPLGRPGWAKWAVSEEPRCVGHFGSASICWSGMGVALVEDW